ncbi:hypothetical protein ACFLQR_02215 [Verrucomicrobiota bacterium]
MQTMVIGAIIGCGALYGLIQYVIVPMRVNLRESKSEINRIEAKLDEARIAVKERSLIQEQLDDVQEAMKKAAKRIPLPILGNYMLEMEEAIRGCVDGTKVDIITVVQGGEPLKLQGETDRLSVFQTRVVARCGLYDLAKFLRNVATKHPYLSVSNLSITPQDDSPERHNITFLAAWLIWTDPDKRPDFIMASEEGEVIEQ